MSAEGPRWIPVFPLRVVLFPGSLLPLHIFEPRYQSLMRRCTEEPIPFSVFLARGENLAAVGCEGWIEQVLHRYPDGRMDLLVRGGGRVGLLGVREHPDGYLEGKMGLVEDQPEPEDTGMRGNLLELFAAYRRLLEDGGTISAEEGSVLRSPSGAIEGPGYTFLLAAESWLSLEEKQKLLETVSERARGQALLGHLTQQVPILRSQVAQIAIVRGNGRLTHSG